ncbi:TPM domain-containing protein [Olleya sp. HaHaR_3_96]|uniref:TPM domain-containing protein n=1 Tax=Olleya sp. HaHaR_3_96 TaxID=2745560 RepID=UPI001C4F32A1|nr:TPM domain-containing protein [Olleya sp. HaHaR_3_96]QXP60632.1 TPM domain-containing protein [Olleya sp. HaHaR_3_96]
MFKKLKILFVLFFICIQYTNAQDYPIISDMVTDNAAIFSNEEAELLRQKLVSYEVKSSHEIVVLTIPGLDGDSIENYAYYVFNEEGNNFGKEGIDNGILILISPNDRKVRIEVGDGLEHIITDAFSSRVIREELTPLFKQGRYFEGVDAATSELIKLIDDPIYANDFANSIEAETVSTTDKSTDGVHFITKLIASCVLLIFYFWVGVYGYYKLIIKKSFKTFKLKTLYKNYKNKFLIYTGIALLIVNSFYVFFMKLFFGLLLTGFLSIFVFVGYFVLLKYAFTRAILIFKSLFTGQLGVFIYLFYIPTTLFLFVAGFLFGSLPIVMGFFFMLNLVFGEDINRFMANVEFIYVLFFFISVIILLHFIAVYFAIYQIKGDYNKTFGFSFFKRDA